MTTEVSNFDDVIDSRDVIARIEEIESETENSPLSEDDIGELAILKELAKQGEEYAPDWRYGETLVRDSYFEQYAEELAEDRGMIPEGSKWPITCIDWKKAARELQYDYTAVDFDGVTYWIR